MSRKIDLTISPESNCPRFDACSINKCPLSKRYEKLKNDSSDPSKRFKERCTDKSIRKIIGKDFGLKFQGMTTREFSSEKNWNNLSEKEKEIRIKKLKGFLPKARLLKKRRGISGNKGFTSQLGVKKFENVNFNHITTTPETKFDIINKK